jgi:hypothetical protein
VKHNGGIETRFGGLITIDHRPALRCGERVIASVTLKQFVGDRGFGDGPVLIKYAFRTADERSVLGEFAATESSFFNVDTGDEIAVRYIANRPNISAPEDTLSIVRRIQRPAGDGQDVG